MDKIGNNEIRLEGAPICEGIAIGVPYFYQPVHESLPNFKVRKDQVEGEIDRYRGAIEESKREIESLRGRLKDEGVNEDVSAILDTHLSLMDDPTFTSEVEERIRADQRNTEQVFQSAVSEYTAKFERIEDPFFRERVGDLQDVAHRILKRLRSTVCTSLLNVPENSIVFAEQLSPSDTAEAPPSRILAFVTELGGATSHSAIMARAKGIPYVAQVDFRGANEFDQKPVIVDGKAGVVILNPAPETLAHYESLRTSYDAQMAELATQASFAAETVDGYEVSLSANVEVHNEVELMHEYGAAGVGLFRSEYICLSRDAFPEEEEQYQIYKLMAESVKDRSLVIRTFDIGGDKFRHLHPDGEEENPFLGCRAIRLMLRETGSFRTQLRAILRASIHGDVRILLPMISGLPELREAKGHIRDAMTELSEEGIPCNEEIQIGCMIEVPSAAITCDQIVQECDFLSIGTNDLVQYTLAVDRDNQAMSYLYSPAHPAVIRLIRNVVIEGNRHSVKVSICGEMAADPHFTALLLGLGVHELSVATRYIPLIKDTIRRTCILRAEQLATDALQMATDHDILNAITEEYQLTV